MLPISRRKLRELMKARDGPFVSIYMPTHRAGRSVQQDPIRLKNLVAEAEECLVAAGFGRAAAWRLLEPAQRLPAQGIFRQERDDGLAIFIAPDYFDALSLPLDFEELVVVSDHFHLAPLLPLVVDDGGFYILALSQNDVRLLSCTRFACREIEPVGIPRKIDEVIRFADLEKTLQHRADRKGSGRVRTAIWHGHGEKQERARDFLLRYSRRIDRGLRRLLQGERAPLVVAGVEELVAIYRQANTYPHLVEAHIEGNPESLSAAELHERALPLVEPLFEQPRLEAEARFKARLGTGLASTDLKEILVAAHAGRIESLFVATDRQVWGAFDPETREITIRPEPEPGDEDLLGVAAIRTLSLGGAVYPLPDEAIPGGEPIAAVYQQW